MFGTIFRLGNDELLIGKYVNTRHTLAITRTRGYVSTKSTVCSLSGLHMTTDKVLTIPSGKPIEYSYFHQNNCLNSINKCLLYIL